jgi:hypothetical protein
MGVSDQRHARPRFIPGKDLPCPLDRRLAGPQSLSDTEARGKTLCLCRKSKPCCLVCSQYNVLATQLYKT